MLLLNALALTTSALQDINRLKDMLLPPTLSKSLFSSSVSPSLMEKNEVQVIKGTRYYETNEPSKGNFFMKGNRIPLIIGGVLLVAIFTAFIVQLVQHLRHFHRPQMQKGYIRIIAITPIYAVTSYMVLLEPEIKGIIAVFRVCFEGYVMYIFAVLMVLFCGGISLSFAPSRCVNLCRFQRISDGRRRGYWSTCQYKYVPIGIRYNTHSQTYIHTYIHT